jgi:hypothetical protein
MQGFMKYAFGMTVAIMIRIIKFSTGVLKLLGGIHVQTHRQQGNPANILLFLAYFPYFEKTKIGL